MKVKYSELTKDVLYRMYWTDGKNLCAIGKEIGCSNKTIQRYMKKSNIERRGVAEARKGSHLSEETRKKISESLKGGQCSEETRKKLSEANRGHHPTEEAIRKTSEANRGRHHSEETKRKMSEVHRNPSEETRRKISEANIGKHLSEETRRKLSEAMKGKKSPFYGKHHSEETKRKMSEACNKILRVHKGEKNPFYGKHHSEETKRKLREASKGRCPSEETRRKISKAELGEKHHNWQGGISFDPYCPKFNFALKEKIREKYGRKCFLCGKSEGETGEKLCVHHVDGDKTQGCNGKQWLLIPLCRSCHTKIHHQDKRVNDKLLFKLSTEGYARSCQQPHNASLNDYIFTPEGEEEGIFLEAIEI